MHFNLRDFVQNWLEMAGGFRCCDTLWFTVILLQLVYLRLRWDESVTCPYPIYLWLQVFCLLLMFFRLMTMFSPRRLTLRASKICLWFKICAVIPTNWSWTALGIYWQIKNLLTSDTCIPPSAPNWTIYCWLALSVAVDIYLVMLVYYMIRLYRARRRFENFYANNVLLTEESVESFSIPVQVENDQEASGLTEDEIRKLEHFRFSKDNFTESFVRNNQCAICTEGFKDEESVVKLPVCGHVYHNPCVENWLVTKANCPLCRADVHANLDVHIATNWAI